MWEYKVHGSKYWYYLIRYQKRKASVAETLRSYYWTWKDWIPRIAKAKVYPTQREAEKDKCEFISYTNTDE